MIPTVLSCNHPDTAAAVDMALETGRTIIFPTDTVYGIGGNPWDTRTLARVCKLKGRDPTQPFTLHLGEVGTIGRFARLDKRLCQIVDRLLPGPYTLLLPAGPDAPPSTVLEGKIGIRVPDHPFFQAVIALLDRPLFGTSVNRHGEPPLDGIDVIIDRFSAVEWIITGPVGLTSSTILDLTTRPGSLIRGAPLPAAIQQVLQ